MMNDFNNYSYPANQKAFSIAMIILAVYNCVFSQLYSMLTLSGIAETSISFFSLALLILSGGYSIKPKFQMWVLPLFIFFFNLILNYSNSIVRDICVWSIGIYLVTGAYHTTLYINLLRIFFGGGILYAASIIFQYLLPDVYFSVYQPLFKAEYGEVVYRMWNSMFGVPAGLSHQVGYSVSYIVVAFGYFFFALRSQISKKLSIVYFVLFLVTLLLCKKRMHFATSLLSISIVYCLSVSGLKRTKRIIVLGSLFITGIFLALMVFDHLGISSVFDRYLYSIELENSGESISESRIGLRASAIDTWLASPIFGIGWLQYQNIGADYTTAHNVFLQLLCETGVIGTALFLIPIIFSLFRSYSLLLKYKDCISDGYNLVQFGVYYQTFFFLYFFTGNPLYDYPYLIPYFICVAICHYYYLNREL